MASTACFLHYHAGLSRPAAARTSSQRYVLPLKAGQLVCRAQKQTAAQEDDVGSPTLSRRLALTALIGATAIGSKISLADAAFAESVPRESAASVVKVVALCGSLSENSVNLRLIHEAIDIAKKSIPGLEIEYVEIAPLPFLIPDKKPYPPEVVDFRNKIQAADSILFASPEYNYSVPGGLKNAIDWASMPPNVMDGKTAAIVSTGYDLGGSRMQYQLREMGVRLDLFFINRPQFFLDVPESDGGGSVIDPKVKKELEEILWSLYKFTLRLRDKHA